MAISIYEDKQAIKTILETDSYIKKAGIVPDNVKTTKASTEVLNDTNPNLQIFISNATSENIGSDIAKGVVYSVNVVGKITQANRIENIMQQIIALLHNKEIVQSHILYLLDPPLELEGNNALYSLRTTFLCQSTVYNRILK